MIVKQCFPLYLFITSENHALTKVFALKVYSKLH